MQTFHELLTEGTQLLVSAGIEEARLDAWLLLEYTADIGRAWYYAHRKRKQEKKQPSNILNYVNKEQSISRFSI